MMPIFLSKINAWIQLRTEPNEGIAGQSRRAELSFSGGFPGDHENTGVHCKAYTNARIVPSSRSGFNVRSEVRSPTV